ncbi:MAG: translation elongation factor Ts [Pirellulales bacterium]|nr:translation elongation factor Ts [Pirellulales bacterium]
MAEITAALVKALRERTGLPMMDCKKALGEASGDLDQAVEILRKAGKKTMEKRVGRATSCGRIALYTDPERGVAAMVELQCESAPVAANEQFVKLAGDLAKQLAVGPGASTPDALLDQPCPDEPKKKLRQAFDDLNNQIREVFNLARLVRIDGVCGGYAHHNGAAAVLLEIDGGNQDLAKDICMHVAAMRPKVVAVGDLDPTLVAKEREILSEAARGEGKPENIIAKMVEGRLHGFYAEQCLAEQPYVKDDSRTVGQVAKEAGMAIKRFVHWELGKE